MNAETVALTVFMCTMLQCCVTAMKTYCDNGHSQSHVGKYRLGLQLIDTVN